MADEASLVMESRSPSPSPSASGSGSGSDDSMDDPGVSITITYRGQTREQTFLTGSTVKHLAQAVRAEVGIVEENQKYLVSGVGLIRPTTTAALDRPLTDLANRKVVLIGTETERIQAFQAAEQSAAHRDAMRRAARRGGNSSGRRHGHHRSRSDVEKYRFHRIEPLPNLPDPARSRALLERLASDRGIRTAMAKFHLAVDVLTEMEPLSNTQSTHEGTTRLLGLNRNHGQAIELRLWTDAYDGYRDYNTIRKTLCHELAHNRHGEHDRKFWDFCHEIEREVHAATTGRTVGEDATFAPSREDDVHDHGGWTGGEYVLGSGTAPIDTSNLTKREILARAAEERRRRMDDDDPNGGNQGSGSTS